MRHFLRLSLLLLFATKSLWAQVDSSQAKVDTTKLQITSLFGLPVVYYTPETRWGFGLAGLAAFRLPNEPRHSRSSQLQLGAVYTQEKQLLLYLPYVLFAKDESYWAYGEIGYYRYTYFYYGNGNEDLQPEGELYDVNFPRLRLHALRKLAPGWYLGGHYWLDVFDIQNTQPGGLLASKQREITGRNGGIISGPGLISIYDRRNDFNSPTRGYYAEALFQVNAPWTGSTFNYTRTSLDLRGFLPIWPQQEHVLAGQIYADLTSGAPPFNALALLGGPKRMRGYYEGRYRARNLLGGQMEYRAHLFWRLGATAFVAGGAVFEQWEELSREVLRYTWGGGLRVRISQADRINVRFDVGIAEGTPAYYLTVGEAF
jgi:hypothetical protein